MADTELYRAKPGEVLTHRSHPGALIHAETNPCPEGRCLYVLDWTDVRNVVYRQGALSHRGQKVVERVFPCTRMPTNAILGAL